MGYLSTVTLLCNEAMAKAVDKIVEKWTKDYDWVAPEIEVDTETKITKYQWDWMKWYSNNGFLSGDIENLLDVADGISLVSSMQSENYFTDPVKHYDKKPEAPDPEILDYAYVYLRIGESEGDVEFRRNCEGTPMEDIGLISELNLDGFIFESKKKEGAENACVS